MKTIYRANHDNIKGDELLKVDEGIDFEKKITFYAILETVEKTETLKTFNNKFEAVNFVDNFKTT